MLSRLQRYIFHCNGFFLVFPLLCVGRAGTDRRLNGEDARREPIGSQARGLSVKASRRPTQNKLFFLVFIQFNSNAGIYKQKKEAYVFPHTPLSAAIIQPLLQTGLCQRRRGGTPNLRGYPQRPCRERCRPRGHPLRGRKSNRIRCNDTFS